MNTLPEVEETNAPQGILLVDDDDRVLKFLSRMLYSLGHDEVYQAPSGAEGLRLWNGRKEKIWLVISDFVMPGMTGDTMVVQMQKDRRELKVLFVSGNDPDSLNSQVPLRSGRNFLQKPFSISDLRDILRSLAPAGAATA
jgi:two-component system, cell cycle sensor histidine kinase and response regulator CckA